MGSKWSSLPMEWKFDCFGQNEDDCKTPKSSGRPPKFTHNWTALHYAASHGNVEKIQQIYQAEGTVGINRKDFYGKSALYWAAYKGHANCLEVLIENGADVNSQCKHGQAPLHAVSALYPECMSLLIKAGADVDLRDNWGVTPMYTAACNGQLECIKLLIKAGSKFTFINQKTGGIPKQLARHTQMCKWLRQVSQTPRTLQELCAIVVRKRLGQHGLKNIESLHLPETLQNRLQLKDLNSRGS
ncbi:ankyrin repeat and SOCS box protein 5-like [Antedon mediterranea]|uniref:ankyrin repeat and SOCS box protein 5-like n=1 Tax=Antedon mediterranea TaxID=105859 RepID=UPI003AF91F45